MQLSVRLLSFAFIVLFFQPELQAKTPKKYRIPALSESYLEQGQASQDELNPKSIKILVWNMLKGNRKDWSKDYAKIAQANDILLLQEGYLNSKMSKGLAQLDGFLYHMGVSFLYVKDNNVPTGTIIGSKVDPFESGFVRTYDVEPIIKTPKTITHASYSIEGSTEKLLVLNIHGMNFSNHQTFVNHIDQALELIEAHSGPVVFAGDFNTRTKKRMAHLRRVLNKEGMKELGFRFDKRSKVFGNYLDHVFARGLLTRDSVVLKDIKSSDHKPMQVEFYYPAH